MFDAARKQDLVLESDSLAKKDILALSKQVTAAVRDEDRLRILARTAKAAMCDPTVSYGHCRRQFRPVTPR